MLNLTTDKKVSLIVKSLGEMMHAIGVNFLGGPLGPDTEGGEIRLARSVFWQVILIWQQEI